MLPFHLDLFIHFDWVSLYKKLCSHYNALSYKRKTLRKNMKDNAGKKELAQDFK